MSSYVFSILNKNNRREMSQMEDLLSRENISRDKNLDLMSGLFDEEYNMVATGSCFKNTLRCLAVDSNYQGEGLLNSLISNLITEQYNRGNSHLFLYTKYDTAKFFGDLGFYKIADVENEVVFMENKKAGFSDYLLELKKESESIINEPLDKRVGAIVMNANPFTLGHRYLVEEAASKCDILHLFVVSEDSSIVSFEDRWELVKQGTSHLNNIIYHQTKSYMISSATFPSYFLREATKVMRAQAKLDIAVFAKIAQSLNITDRFVGDEPFSNVTGIYNEEMQKGLSENNIVVHIINRKENDETPISASNVRKAIHDGNWDLVKKLVPITTLNFLESEKGKVLVEKISKSDDLIHH